MSPDPKSIRILAVDDHALLREGIAALVADQPDMKIVAEASNGREAIEQFRAHNPDITLMDLQMPEMNGIDAMIAVRSEFPDARFIVLTTYSGDVQVSRALKAGARAFLLKSLLRKELLDTIRAVHAGPAPAGSIEDREFRGSGQHLAASAENEIDAVTQLPALERCVFVMSILERYSDWECSVLLGCGTRNVANARVRALRSLPEPAAFMSGSGPHASEFVGIPA